jgi:hypothetical protein
MTETLERLATKRTRCDHCKAHIELPGIAPPRDKPGSRRWRGACPKCGTEMTVTELAETTTTKLKDADWKRQGPGGRR